MREGKVIRTNVHVTVRLRNRSRLRGVVKNERFIERVDGLSFVPSELRAPGAGLRLWYYNNTDSYIFLPYDTILKHHIGRKLTDDEVHEIAKRIENERLQAEEERRRRDLRQKAEAQQKADRERRARGNDRPRVGNEPESQLSEQQKALLAEFPPDQGWGIDKFREIEQRKIQVGVYPDERSQRFLEMFGEWNEANELHKAGEKRAQSSQPLPAPTPLSTKN